MLVLGYLFLVSCYYLILDIINFFGTGSLEFKRSFLIMRRCNLRCLLWGKSRFIASFLWPLFPAFLHNFLRSLKRISISLTNTFSPGVLCQKLSSRGVSYLNLICVFIVLTKLRIVKQILYGLQIEILFLRVKGKLYMFDLGFFGHLLSL